MPETASAADGEAVKPMLEELQSRGVLPEVMLADTAYGGDDNVDVSDKSRSGVGFSPRFSGNNAVAWAKAHPTTTFVGHVIFSFSAIPVES